MLVLSRKKKESIIINDNIEIKVIEVSEDQVKLGIAAPRDVRVYRSEIYERIKEEMRAAAAGTPPKLHPAKDVKDTKDAKDDLTKNKSS